MAPVIVLSAPSTSRTGSREGPISRENRIRRGVSFCHVRSSVAESQGKEAIVEGNHWNIGAIPAFVIKARKIKVGERAPKSVTQMAGASKNKIDPVAWAIKYLHAAPVLSVEGPVR